MSSMNCILSSEHGGDCLLREAIISIPDSCERYGVLLKSDTRGRVYRLETPTAQLAIKYFPPIWKPMQRMVRRVLKGRYAATIWRRSYAIFTAGIPVAEPIGYLRAAGPWRESYLISKWIEGIPSSEVLVDVTLSHEKRLAMAYSLAQLITAMHSARFSHGDLKPRNVLYGEDGFVLIDLDAVRHHRFSRMLRKRAKRDWHNIIHGLELAGVHPEIIEPLNNASLTEVYL